MKKMQNYFKLRVTRLPAELPISKICQFSPKNHKYFGGKKNTEKILKFFNEVPS